MKANLNHQLNDKNSKGVEILSVGTELLLGNIVNTNAKWISEQLSELGLNHFRQSTVGDNSDRIIQVIQEISKRDTLKDLAIASVVKTSGVGPKPPVVIKRLLLFDIS